MESRIHSLSSNTSNVRQDVFPLDKWTITTRKGIIMQSKCTCKVLEQATTVPLETLTKSTMMAPPKQPEQATTPEQASSEKDLDKEPIELCDICRYHKYLPHLNSMPDMLFNNNLFRLEHISGVGIEFNPLDALRRVEKTQDPLRVAVAEGWQSARADCPFAKNISRPFDWTFTTDYRGTILSAIQKIKRSCPVSNKLVPQQVHVHKEGSQQCGVESPTQRGATLPDAAIDASHHAIQDMIDLRHISDAMQTSDEDRLTLKVEETDERIDVSKLKQREEILFYDDITLYEDELADHGTAQYSVKVRVMPTSMFILARYYLRIDGVLARINDTRVYHELNERYILREYTNREAKLVGLDLPTSTVINPNELMNHLPLIYSCYERLTLPEIPS